MPAQRHTIMTRQRRSRQTTARSRSRIPMPSEAGRETRLPPAEASAAGPPAELIAARSCVDDAVAVRNDWLLSTEVEERTRLDGALWRIRTRAARLVNDEIERAAEWHAQAAVRDDRYVREAVELAVRRGASAEDARLAGAELRESLLDGRVRCQSYVTQLVRGAVQLSAAAQDARPLPSSVPRTSLLRAAERLGG